MKRHLFPVLVTVRGEKSKGRPHMHNINILHKTLESTLPAKDPYTGTNHRIRQATPTTIAVEITAHIYTNLCVRSGGGGGEVEVEGYE